MIHTKFTRRDFLKASTALSLSVASGCSLPSSKPIVSIVKIENDNTDYAVEKAIDLLGGIQTVTKVVISQISDTHFTKDSDSSSLSNHVK